MERIIGIAELTFILTLLTIWPFLLGALVISGAVWFISWIIDKMGQIH